MILDKPLADKTVFVLLVLELKRTCDRTCDQRSDYWERGEAESRETTLSPRAKPQESLGKGVWSRAVESKTHHLCRRSVNTGAFNKEREIGVYWYLFSNHRTRKCIHKRVITNKKLKELKILGHMQNSIRKGLVLNPKP